MKKFLLSILAFLLMVSVCYAVNVTTTSGRFYTITGLDADWYMDNDVAALADSGLSIVSIKFVPSAADDILVIKESRSGSATAAVSCYLKSVDGEPRKDIFSGEPMWPFIDIGDCTLTTPANAKVIFEVIWSKP